MVSSREFLPSLPSTLKMNRELKVGDTVRFIGCSPEQIRWGNNDDPNRNCLVGNTYLVEKVDVFSQHTKIELIGVKGRFNSVCFERATGCIRQAQPLCDI